MIRSLAAWELAREARRLAREHGGVRLHFGCFDQPAHGWLNTDVTPHIFVDRIPFGAKFVRTLGRMDDIRFRQHSEGIFSRVFYLDISKRFPLPTHSVEAAFSSHVVEHLPRLVAKTAISELHRVMVPGAILRIVVPDLDSLVASYRSDDADTFCLGMYEAESARSKNRHHWMYSYPSMMRLLLDGGFREVKRWTFMNGNLPGLDALDNRPESLFVEATA